MTVTSVKESPVVHLRLTTKMSDRITEEETLQSICDEVKIFTKKNWREKIVTSNTL